MAKKVIRLRDAESEQKGPDIVRALYKAAMACADHQEEALIRKLHIATPLDEAIVFAAKEKKVVLVTGNPGDGKTHLIRHVRGELPKGTIVNQDANEVDNASLIRDIDDAVEQARSLVIAINEGILHDVCHQASRKSPWARSVVSSILNPYIYGDDFHDPPKSLAIFDLNQRNNLSGDIVRQALKRIVALASANGRETNVLAENASRISNATVVDRIAALLEAVAARGVHATMRDLSSFVAFLICGGEDHAAGVPPKPYFVNAFEGGQGPLFEAVRELDPLYSPSPFLDDRLFMAQDADDEWVVELTNEHKKREDMNSFRERKRRAYFEHKDGLRMLKGMRGDVDKLFQNLLSVDQSPELVAIGLLNRFFDAKDVQADNLFLWMGHQFDARPCRYVAARHSISAADLTVQAPRLPTYLNRAFPDFLPDHVVLKHREMPVSDGLLLDRRLINMLLAGDRQSGIGVRNQEAHARISAFFDKLTKYAKTHGPIVQILRLDNHVRVKVGVNAEDRSYFIAGGTL